MPVRGTHGVRTRSLVVRKTAAVRDRRRGVALLAVLWVLMAVAAVSSLQLRALTQGARAGAFRVASMRGRWLVQGCFAARRAQLDRALRDGRDDEWRYRPGRLRESACRLVVTAPDSGPVDVNTAPAELLATLPAFTPGVVDAVLERRAWGERIDGIDRLLALLPPPLADQVRSVYPELAGRIVFDPVGWIVRGRVTVDGRDLEVMREYWVRAGARVAVVRREIF